MDNPDCLGTDFVIVLIQLEAFRDMAKGGKGGSVYFNYVGTVPIRAYYFRGWSDEEFERLLKLLGEEL